MSKFSGVERYNQYLFETKDVFILFGMGAFSSAALKYLDRCEFKGTLEEDLNKCLYYLGMASTVSTQSPQISSIGLSRTSEAYSVLNEVTKEEFSIYFQNPYVLRTSIVRDRKERGNKYHSVINFLLKGQFEAAREILILLMDMNKVKIHEQ